jgi:hypothetical protein
MHFAARNVIVTLFTLHVGAQRHGTQNFSPALVTAAEHTGRKPG